jgi:transposase
MAKAYSCDLRERVMAACDGGDRPEEIAPLFRVSARCIYNWLKLRRQTGSVAPRHSRRGPKPKLAEHSQRLRELVAERPDATLEELRNELPVKVCIGTLWKALRCLGLSFKKR